MANLSPKIEIINHFDELINQVDIDIEESIKKYKEDQDLGEIECFLVEDRKDIINHRKYFESEIEYFDSKESSQSNSSQCEEDNEWSESTKVIDYLNQIRQKTIDELRKAQEESLVNLKSESCDLNHLKESKDVEEMKSRLFADKFYFQVLYKPKNKISWIFNLFTIVVDFYLSPSDIKFLELLINSIDIWQRNEIIPKNKPIFDEKSLLIHSIRERLFENLATQQYPNHVIHIRKQDLLNIKTFSYTGFASELNLTKCSTYLSNLETLHIYQNFNNWQKVNIEGLSSLKSLLLSIETLEGISFANLYSLKQLNLEIKSEINNEISKLFEICPNVEELTLLYGQFSNINLDRFVNLKKLTLWGNILDNFNFDLFKNICNQLEELDFELKNMNDESISKLLYSHSFPNLSYLNISKSKITRLEKKIFDGFPILQSLNVYDNKELKTIDKDAFSNLKNLKKLILSSNHLINLDPELFSSLSNLEKLDLENFELGHFDLKIMDYIVNIKEIRLNYNFITNKDEVSNRLKQSINSIFDF